MPFFDFFRKSINVETKSHMKNLIEVALVDGHFDDDEFELLFRLAEKHSLTRDEILSIKKELSDVPFVVPANEQRRFNQLYELIQMMLADGFVDRGEMRLCTLFAKRFGYPEFRAEELVDSVARNIETGNPPEETLKRVSWLIRS